MFIRGGTATLDVVQRARAASAPFARHQCTGEANVDAWSRSREIHERDTHDRGGSRARSTNACQLAAFESI
jgi:hypothetical protein